MQSVKSNNMPLSPLKIVVPGHFYDCQIYRGKLYLWTMDGFVQVYDWNKLVNYVVMPKFTVRLPFVFGFMEGNFLYNKKVSYIFGEDVFHSVLLEQYQSLANQQIVIAAEDLAKAKLQELNVPLNELPIDTEVFANNLYFAVDSGIYRKVLHFSANEPSIGPKDTQLWDCRVLSLRANKFPQIALSAGSEGLFELNLVKDATIRPQAIESVEETNVYRISNKPSSFSNYSFLSVFSSSYVEESFLALFNWKPLNDDLRVANRELKVYRDFDRVYDEKTIFGGGANSDICWGIDDKIYRIKGDVLDILKFNNAANVEKGEVYYQALDSVKLPANIGRPISAGATYFGIVLEFTKGVVVLRSDGGITSFPKEVVRWRVYPRSKNYLNHLHLLLDDRLEVYSFNHDSLVNQATKRVGIEYVPDEEPAYKSRNASKTLAAIDFPAKVPLQSGDFNEFNLDEFELPF
jgi:hypothetical protein